MNKHWWISILIFLGMWASSGYAQEPFDWVEIPPKATEQQIQKLIQEKIKSLLEGEEGEILYSKATQLHSEWRKTRLDMVESWRKSFYQREEQFRKNLAKIIDLKQEYTEMATALEVYSITLNARRKSLQNIEEKRRALGLEIEANQRNLHAQLNDLPYQVMMLGEVKIPKNIGVNLSGEQIKNQLGLAIQMEAIQQVNGALINSLEEINKNKLISSQLRSTKEGRAQVIEFYPSDLSKNWTEEGRRQGRIHYLFHALEVYPFQAPNQEANSRILQVKPSSLNPLPQVMALNSSKDFESFPHKNENLEMFVEDWIRSIQNNNQQINQKIATIRNGYQEKDQSLKQKLNSLEKGRQPAQCGVYLYIIGVDGEKGLQNEEMTWKELCKQMKPLKWSNLSAKLQSWKKEKWSPTEQSFQQAWQEYKDWYSNRAIRLDRVDKGKLENKTDLETYQRVGLKTWEDIRLEAKGLSYRENVLILDDEVESYKETMIKYRPTPKRFAIIYLSSEDSSSEVNFIANLGFEYQLTPTKQGQQSIQLQLPKLKKARCTKKRLKTMIGLSKTGDFPLKLILERCGE